VSEGPVRGSDVATDVAAQAPTDGPDLLGKASPATPQTVRAETYLKHWPTDSHPILLKCSDQDRYIVKALQPNQPNKEQMGRVLTNEQIVGRLGRELGAPVAEVVLVDVSQELIDMEPELQHIAAGLAHGSRLVADNMPREGSVTARCLRTASDSLVWPSSTAGCRRVTINSSISSRRLSLSTRWIMGTSSLVDPNGKPRTSQVQLLLSRTSSSHQDVT